MNCFFTHCPVDGRSQALEVDHQQYDHAYRLGQHVYPGRLRSDYENRLTSVSGAATAAFTYDGDGNRVKSVVGATTTLFVGSHYESSGGVVARYYLAGGTRVAMRTGSASFYWLLSDHPSQTAA